MIPAGRAWPKPPARRGRGAPRGGSRRPRSSRPAAGNGSYEVAHSADALLLGASGRVVGEIYFGEDENSVFAKLTTLAPEPLCRPGAPGPADLWAPTAAFGPGQLCRAG